MGGHSILELIHRKRAEGIFPIGIAAMRALKNYYPTHESPMWLALRFDPEHPADVRLDLSLEAVMLQREWKTLFESVDDGNELLAWAHSGRYPLGVDTQ